MFFNSQSEVEKKRYKELLNILGSLSKLYSDSNTPYLYYRGAERAFCTAFDAIDHSRGDTAIDAGKNGVGIGLKTFLEGNGRSFQKVAEFNSESANFRPLFTTPDALVREIAKLRNNRLEFAQRTHDVENLVYHCVTRKPGVFLLSEEKMDLVNIDGIQIIDTKDNSIHFSDGIHDYNFSLTKSTLLKRFVSNPIFSFNVEILDNPFEYLVGMSGSGVTSEIIGNSSQLNYPVTALNKVILPLYSEKGFKHVPEKSQLNQWNAGGRVRQNREAYILIPSWIHRVFSGFFPDRDTPFTLVLPNGGQMIAKVCQDGSKALMSNPNTALGKWLIDDVLSLNEGEIVTLEKLESIGIDSVEISKESNEIYHIDFKRVGSYDAFKNEYLRSISEGEEGTEENDE